MRTSPKAMNGSGLVVYAQDHRGHGATAGEGVLGRWRNRLPAGDSTS